MACANSQNGNLENSVNLCLEHARNTGYARLSVQQFDTELKLFKEWCAENNIKALNEIDIDILRNYFKYCIERDLSGYTIKIKRNCLRYFFNFLKKTKIIKSNPMAELKIKLNLNKKEISPLSLNDMAKLLKAAERKYQNIKKRYKWVALRNKLILKVLFATGIRACEIAALKVKDVNLKQGTINIHGKGSNWYIKRNRIAFIDDHVLLDELKIYLQKLQPEQALFKNLYGGHLKENTIYGILDKLAKNANLNRNVGSHLIRHSFCTYLINQGADVFTVQQLMGHWKVETTLHYYLHLTQKEVKEDWQQFNPLIGGEQ